MDMQKRATHIPKHESVRPLQWWEQPRQWHQLALLTECINAELKSPIPLRDIDPAFRWVMSPQGEFYSLPYHIEFGGLPVEMAQPDRAAIIDDFKAVMDDTEKSIDAAIEHVETKARDFAPDGQVVS